MVVQGTENPSDCRPQTGKAKSGQGRLVARIASLVTQAGLDYDCRYGAAE
jgi:hypothetical protein